MSDIYLRKSFPAGTEIFHSGDLGNCAYIIAEGEIENARAVDIYRQGLDNYDRRIYELTGSAYVGRIWTIRRDSPFGQDIVVYARHRATLKLDATGQSDDYNALKLKREVL
jgi:hypothetical protein